MTNRHPAPADAAKPSLLPVAILVFTTKLMVATFLVAQVAMPTEAPVLQAYGLTR